MASKATSCASTTRRPVQRLTPVKASVQQADGIKSKILQKAGSKNGLDRNPQQHEELRGIVDELASTSGKHDMDLTGTTWTLRYTDSTGSSAGKLGPLTGYVEQEFPANEKGFYYNRVNFGLLKAKLRAEYFKVRDDKINVNFTDFTFFLGPFKISKAFGGSGHWILKFTDPSLRVLDTNAKHIFVLERLPGTTLNF
ncbi:hypothetical protein WJX73_000674 [Symbiochloris irregularis]|uniref:Plastid lipid-associated protein/fibrillin conserved domain-containing protein n=1 Tax=Symbiochloris irregularis TaxID=706552 RepID=A0AAW1NYL1_9CHLO